MTDRPDNLEPTPEGPQEDAVEAVEPAAGQPVDPPAELPAEGEAAVDESASAEGASDASADEFGTAEAVEELEAFASQLNDELAFDEVELAQARQARQAEQQADEDGQDEPEVQDEAPSDEQAVDESDAERVVDRVDAEPETIETSAVEEGRTPGTIVTTEDEEDLDVEVEPSGDADEPEDDESTETESSEKDTVEVHLGPDGKPILPEGTDEPGLVESIVLVSANPISAAKIARTLASEGFTPGKVKAVVGHLNECYANEGRAFRIQEIAGGYQFYTLAPYADVLARLVKAPTEVSLSQAALEVLAIVAYKQPIIRADVEAIRGVSCGPLLRHLLDINLIRIVGKSDQLGRPLLYGTTKKFLEHFGLGELKDLPKSGALSEPK